MPINVAIVEDNAKILTGLELLIGSSPNFVCVGAFPNAESALERLSSLSTDVILMDIELPGISGIECIERLAEQGTTAQIMIMTVFEDHETIYRSIVAGATGYLLKSTPPAELLAAIAELHSGGSPMSSQIARKVLKTLQEIATERTPQIKQSAVAVSAREAHEYSLGKREQEIIEHLSKGLSYQEIADQTFLSHATIRTHIHNIYRKVQVKSRSEMLSKFTK